VAGAGIFFSLGMVLSQTSGFYKLSIFFLFNHSVFPDTHFNMQVFTFCFGSSLWRSR
jgi:hypothetical protein